MCALKKEISEVISLMQLYLSQEYESNQSIFIEKDSLEYFKSFTSQNTKQKSSTLPTPSPNPSTLPFNNANTLAPKFPAKKESIQQKALPKKEEEKSLVKSKIFLDQNETPTTPKDDFHDLHQLMKKLFPKQILLDNTPIPKQKLSLSPHVLILIDQPSLQQSTLLSNLAKAIQLCLCPTVVLKIEDKPIEELVKLGSVKILMGTESALDKFEKQHPNIQRLLLPPLTTLLEDPSKKGLLWKEICKALQ